MKKREAFALVEVLVVIAIIGLLASIVLVSIRGVQEKSRVSKALNFAAQVHHSMGAYAAGVWNLDEGTNGTCFFGEDVCDSSGNENHGENNGATWRCAADDTDYTVSHTGCSLEFSGSTGVNCGNSTSLQYDGNVTICFWAKSYNFSSPARQNPINKAYGGEGTITLETDGSLSFYFGSCGGNCSPYTNMRADAIFTKNNVWVHICATRNISLRQVDWYKDGDFFQTRTWSNPAYDPSPSNNNFIIGDGYVYPFNGLIDEVHIYKETLTSTQIKKLYVEGAKKHGLLSRE
jgi:prepilin-type N-terminal cleavage/methylation domain-containing protein